jgi:hypothetical protein
MALDRGALVTIKETILDPDKPDAFIAWLDGALALKISLPPPSFSRRASGSSGREDWCAWR